MLKNLAEYNKYRHTTREPMPNQFPARHEENQYLNLIDEILSEGTREDGRNGTTLVAVGAAMHFSLNDRRVPFLTTKRLAWNTCLKELLWFIRGQTDNRLLQAQNVHIWDGNSNGRSDGDLGPIYGFQWRNFGGEYPAINDDNYKKGVDQLQAVIDALKDPEQRTSRRLIITAWNPCQLPEMALPPCHVLMQFHVTDGTRLSCSLYQRSGDVGCQLGGLGSGCWLAKTAQPPGQHLAWAGAFGATSRQRCSQRRAADAESTQRHQAAGGRLGIGHHRGF